MKNRIIFPSTNPNSPKIESERRLKSNFILFSRMNNFLDYRQCQIPDY